MEVGLKFCGETFFPKGESEVMLKHYNIEIKDF